MKDLEASNWQFSHISEVASQIAQKEQSLDIITEFLAFVQTAPQVSAYWCNQPWVGSNIHETYPDEPIPPKSLSKSTHTPTRTWLCSGAVTVSSILGVHVPGQEPWSNN